MRIDHELFPQTWYLGFNTYLDKYIAWSDTEGPTKSAKMFDKISELRDYLRWALSRGWNISATWPENISEFR